jgi:hypothetical protein
MSNLKKLALFLAPLVLFTILPGLLSAQDDTSGKVSATGCVKSGHGGEGYYLMGQDGKMYELWGKGVGEHVNHTVTVTGTLAKLTPAQETKKESSEKSEAGTASYVDMKVSSLKMVSDSCK